LSTVSDGVAAQDKVSPALIAKCCDVPNADRFARGLRKRGFGRGYDVLLIKVAQFTHAAMPISLIRMELRAIGRNSVSRRGKHFQLAGFCMIVAQRS
jgi:hypothetical protein